MSTGGSTSTRSTSVSIPALSRDNTFSVPDRLAHFNGATSIGDEPLHWQPPDNWVTVTAWPGADPARTDPAPIHHALLEEDIPPAQITADLASPSATCARS